MVDSWNNVPPPEDPGIPEELILDQGNPDDLTGDREDPTVGRDQPREQGENSGQSDDIAAQVQARVEAEKIETLAAAGVNPLADNNGTAGAAGNCGGNAGNNGSGNSYAEVPALEPGAPAPVATAYVRQCINANELGDGLLFSALHRQNYIFNKSSAEWLAWVGHYWERDEMERALAAVEDVTERYLEAAGELTEKISSASNEMAAAVAGLATAENPDKALIDKRDKKSELISTLKEKRKKFIKRADKLRSENGRQACLKFARTNRQSLAVLGDRLDSEPMLLATPTGVIDLETGKVRPGRQADYITKASPTLWTGFAAQPELFLKTLSEIFSDSQAIVDYLQRLLGYGITGRVNEHIFPVFQGRGRNGKTMLLEIVREVLGPLAAPIRPELLLEQAKNRSAAAPSPDIMALRGLRLAIAEETDEGSRFSASRVKWLSGGNELTGRNPHDKYDSTFNPSHLLILCTNNRPGAPASDYAFWRRMRLIEFNLSFVDNPQADHERPVNKDLGAQILASERSQILAWLVEGCLKWQADGLNPPAEVLDATHQYQREEDMVGDFIDECLLVEAGKKAKATAIYQLFVSWYSVTQGRKPPSQKWFGKQLTARFDKRKSNGITMYYGFDVNWAAANDYPTPGDH